MGLNFSKMRNLEIPSRVEKTVTKVISSKGNLYEIAQLAGQLHVGMDLYLWNSFDQIGLSNGLFLSECCKIHKT